MNILLYISLLSSATACSLSGQFYAVSFSYQLARNARFYSITWFSGAQQLAFKLFFSSPTLLGLGEWLFGRLLCGH